MIKDDFLETVLIKAWIPQDDAFGYFVEQAEPILNDWVITNVVWQLNEDQLANFTDLAEKRANEDEIYKYLCSVIPDYERFIQKVYDDFEKMYLENFKEFSK